MIYPRLVFLAVVFFALSPAISAQVTFDGCLDIRGMAVASIPNNNLNDVAMAVLSPKDEPVIIYNPLALSWSQPQTRLFFYYHECAHHALGHVFISLLGLIELFRQMVETYKAKLEEEEFFRLQAKLARRARKKGVFTEKEVERIIFEDR